MSNQDTERDDDIFPGFGRPTYTMVPDELFDVLLAKLSGTEVKVLLYIIRHTFGYKKDSDNISLSQMVEGIRTREGRVIDRGAGVKKSAAAAAVASLEKHGIIKRVRNQSPTKGYEASTYALRSLGDPLSKKWTSPSPKNGQAPVQKMDIQQTTKQEITKQQHGGGIRKPYQTNDSGPVSRNGSIPLAVSTEGVAKALHDFGLSPDAANELAQAYPEDHILAKLDYVQWLREAHPQQVKSNVAGFLRRAIERDFAPPADYQTPAQRAAKTKAAAAQDAVLSEHEQAYDDAREQRQERLHAACPPQPVPGTDLTTETVWQRVYDELTGELSHLNLSTWVKPATLASCEHGTAVIVAAYAHQAEHLATRLSNQVASAFYRVLGLPIRCQFLALDELPAPALVVSTGEGSRGAAPDSSTRRQRVVG